MPLKPLTFLLNVTFNTFPVQSRQVPGYTGIMDKVYAVFQGEQYESERLVSLHASLAGALDAARELARPDEDGIKYSPSKDGRLWMDGLSGHFIEVKEQPLLG